MKRFSFNLDSVLSLREFYKKEAEAELARAISESERIQVQLKANAQNRLSANANRSGASLEQMVAIEQYIQFLDHSTENLLQEAAQADLVVEQKRAVYIDKMKDVKALEHLKDRRKMEHIKAQQIEETYVVDDMINAKHHLS